MFLCHLIILFSSSLSCNSQNVLECLVCKIMSVGILHCIVLCALAVCQSMSSQLVLSCMAILWETGGTIQNVGFSYNKYKAEVLWHVIVYQDLASWRYLFMRWIHFTTYTPEWFEAVITYPVHQITTSVFVELVIGLLVCWSVPALFEHYIFSSYTGHTNM